MAKDWIMVRISKHTHADLERVRASMEIAEEMGLVSLERDPRDRVSLDQVIARLIAFRDKHAERSRRSKAKRQARSEKSLSESLLQKETEGGEGGVKSEIPSNSHNEQESLP